MLIKWITCHVTDRDDFDRGQRRWEELSQLAGFVGQGGGWSRSTPENAHIFGCWEDRSSYDRFMAESHDRVAVTQLAAYDAIEVRFFESLLTIGEGFSADLAGTQVVRLAHCRVRSDRREHFVAAQADVWNPGIAAAPGMLGGVFGTSGETEFLVLTEWDSGEDHQRHVTDRFPRLRERSGAAEDLEQIAGDLIVIEPAWTVASGR
jgi:quinol monooxygenase YgiN